MLGLMCYNLKHTVYTAVAKIKQFNKKLNSNKEMQTQIQINNQTIMLADIVWICVSSNKRIS